MLAFVLGASSVLGSARQRRAISNGIGRQDERIAAQVAAREGCDGTAARRDGLRTRRGVAETTAGRRGAGAEQRVVRDRLLASRDALAAARERQARDARRDSRRTERTFVAEVEALERESAALAARIRASQAAGTGSDGLGRCPRAASAGPSTAR